MGAAAQFLVSGSDLGANRLLRISRWTRESRCCRWSGFPAAQRRSAWLEGGRDHPLHTRALAGI